MVDAAFTLWRSDFRIPPGEMINAPGHRVNFMWPRSNQAIQASVLFNEESLTMHITALMMPRQALQLFGLDEYESIPLRFLLNMSYPRADTIATPELKFENRTVVEVALSEDILLPGQVQSALRALESGHFNGPFEFLMQAPRETRTLRVKSEEIFVRVTMEVDQNTTSRLLFALIECASGELLHNIKYLDFKTDFPGLDTSMLDRTYARPHVPNNYYHKVYEVPNATSMAVRRARFAPAALPHLWHATVVDKCRFIKMPTPNDLFMHVSAAIRDPMFPAYYRPTTPEIPQTMGVLADVIKIAFLAWSYYSLAIPQDFPHAEPIEDTIRVSFGREYYYSSPYPIMRAPYKGYYNDFRNHRFAEFTINYSASPTESGRLTNVAPLRTALAPYIQYAQPYKTIADVRSLPSVAVDLYRPINKEVAKIPLSDWAGERGAKLLGRRLNPAVTKDALVSIVRIYSDVVLRVAADNLKLDEIRALDIPTFGYIFDVVARHSKDNLNRVPNSLFVDLNAGYGASAFYFALLEKECTVYAYEANATLVNIGNQIRARMTEEMQDVQYAEESRQVIEALSRIHMVHRDFLKEPFYFVENVELVFCDTRAFTPQENLMFYANCKAAMQTAPNSSLVVSRAPEELDANYIKRTHEMGAERFTHSVSTFALFHVLRLNRPPPRPAPPAL